MGKDSLSKDRNASEDLGRNSSYMVRNVPPRRGSNYSRRRIRPGLSAFRLPFPPNRYSFPIQGIHLYPHTRRLPCFFLRHRSTIFIKEELLFISICRCCIAACFFQKDVNQSKYTLTWPTYPFVSYNILDNWDVKKLETHRNALLASLGFAFLNSFWLTGGLPTRHRHVLLLHCVVPEFPHQCGLLLIPCSLRYVCFCRFMPVPPKLMTCHLTEIITVWMWFDVWSVVTSSGYSSHFVGIDLVPIYQDVLEWLKSSWHVRLAAFFAISWCWAHQISSSSHWQ